MRRFINRSILTLCVACVAFVAEATVKVTPATGGTNILADVAGDSLSPDWTTLGPISIIERKKSDFGTGTNVTLVLSAPDGFEFNTSLAPHVSFTGGRDISAASAVVANSLTLRVTFTVSGTSGLDTLTIGDTQGLQVRAASMAPLARGSIVRPSGASGGTALISGVKSESAKGKGAVTDFGGLVEVAGAPTQLGFRVEPSSSAVIGNVLGNQPVIAVQDTGGNVRTTDNGRVVTAQLSSGPGTLSGTSTAVTVNGVATFTNLALSDVGVVTLTFSTSNLTSAVSAPIAVFPSPPPQPVATSLSIRTQPSSVNTAGALFTQQPVVVIVDQYDFPFTNENSAIVTAANLDTSDPLQGTLSVQVVNGVATFTNLFHTNATDLTLQFTSSGLNSAVSSVIKIAPAAASRLVFDVQPDLAGVARPFGIQPVVITQDTFGNDSASGLPATLNVTMSLTSGTGNLGGTAVLDIGTNDGNGVVSFTDLSISTTGTKQLTANASGLSNALSASFEVLPKTNQTITSFVDVPAKVYGDSAFDLSAAASSGLAVTFSAIFGPASISGNNVTLTGAGTVVIRASQAGNADYFAAPSVDQEFTVARRALTVTADNFSRNYGDVNPTFAGSLTGLIDGDAITASYGTTADASSVPGTYTIAITVNDPNGRIGNYIVTKQTGTLTINSVPPSIDTQPHDQTVNEGAPVTLTVGATGPLLSYQWQLNGTNVAGATTSALAFGSVQPSDAGTYAVIMSNGSGNLTSSNAVLTVVLSPHIVAQPTSFHVTAGANFTLPVSSSAGFEVTGVQPFTYQWRKDGNFLATQTTSALRLPSAKTTNSGNYSVVIANPAGITMSAPISVIVGALVGPRILTNPASQDVVIGDPVNLTVVATGPALTYQWYFNGQPLVGATASGFTLPSVQFSDAGDYSVLVSNTVASLVSSNATLVVNYDPNVLLTNDLDLDGHIDVMVQSTNVLGTNNYLGVWNLDNTNFFGSFLLNNGLPLTPGWVLVGKGDFNHDQQVDYVFQNGGFIYLSLMNGTNLSSSVAVNTNAFSKAWKVMGARDFNRDGNTDLIMRHSTGVTAVWLMRGTKVLKKVLVMNMSPGFQLVGLDDFNKDGNTDLLWQHKTSGKMFVTYLNRTHVKKTVRIAMAPAPVKSWNVVGLVDLDRANSRDILWQNKTNHTLLSWSMNGTNVLGTNYLNLVVPAEWSIVGEK